MLLQRTFPLFALLIIFVHLDIIRALSPDGMTHSFRLIDYLIYESMINIVFYEVLNFCVLGQALVSFRTNIVNSDGVLLQWRPEDPDPCRWKGVTCDPKSKRVTSL